MKRNWYIIALTVLLGSVYLPTFAAKIPFYVTETTFDEEPLSTMNLDVYINGTIGLKLEEIPTEGFLDIYSVLGVKVTSVNLKNCIGSCTLDLPKGIYVLKVGRAAKKIIVK